MNVRQATLAALTVGCLLVPTSGWAQSMRPEDLAQGKIIIAPRDSPDPHFANSVIVLAQYGQTGALGLMIHYRSDMTAKNALKELKGAENRVDKIFIGGPVELPVVFALLRSKSVPAGARAGAQPVVGNLYLMTSRQSIGATLSEGTPASDVRIFLGYSGWGPGQLEREVRRSGWYILDYDESLVFDEHPDTLWNRLIGKTERRIAFLPIPASAGKSGGF